MMRFTPTRLSLLLLTAAGAAAATEASSSPQAIAAESFAPSPSVASLATPWRFGAMPAAKMSAASAPPSVTAMPGPELTFDGIDWQDYAALSSYDYPALDVHGDVGPSHYVNVAKGAIGIHHKTGALAVPMFPMRALFAHLDADHPCRADTFGVGETTVLHDSLADRWLLFTLSYLSTSTTHWFHCVAVSQTADPTGTYFTYVYRLPTGRNNPHFLRMGAWTDAYYATVMFGTEYAAPPDDDSFGAGIFAFDRARLLVGDPSASMLFVDRPTRGEGGILPTDIGGIRPPSAGTPQVLMRYTANEFGPGFIDGVVPYTFVPDFATPAASTLTVGAPIAVMAFDARRPPGAISWLNGETPYGALIDVANHKVSYHNLGTQTAPVDSYTIAWGVNVGGQFAPSPVSYETFTSAIRWTELHRGSGGALTIHDQDTHANVIFQGELAPDYLLPHVAQDHQGNVAVGFQYRSPDFPTDVTPNDLRWAGRVGAAPTGVLNQGEARMYAGSGESFGMPAKLSGINVDPADSCTFYYQGLYHRIEDEPDNNWRWYSRVGRFRFPGCTPAVKAQLNVAVSVCATGAALASADIAFGDGYRRRSAADGTATFTVVPGNYSVIASVPGGASAPTAVTLAAGDNVSINVCVQGPPRFTAQATVVTAESFTPFNLAVDPQEAVTVRFCVANAGFAPTVNLIGTLQAGGGVVAPGGAQNYGVLAAGGAPVCRDISFTAGALTCGDMLNAGLQLNDGATAYGVLPFAIPTGVFQRSALDTFHYAGVPVPIPDGSGSASVPIAVSGLGGRITDVDLWFDAPPGGGACTNANAAVDHTHVGDLVLRLASPTGPQQLIMQQRAFGRNGICGTRFDDDRSLVSILDIPGASTIGAPLRLYGRYRPEAPLSIFDGQAPNGTWLLDVADVALAQTGTLRRYSLDIATETRLCGFAGNPQLFINGFE